MPDESRSIVARVASWWRRGYDAELLAVAPAWDEDGTTPLSWGFPHPVNRSPFWRLLRPWVLIPVIFGVIVMAIPLFIFAVPLPLSYWLSRLALVGTGSAVLGIVVFAARRSSVERLALKAYHSYRWRATRALDATIAEALDHDGNAGRRIDAPSRAPDR